MRDPLSARDPTSAPEGVIGSRAKLRTLSKNSSHRVVEHASHIGLITDQQYARATTQAILDVVTSVRKNQPLAK